MDMKGPSGMTRSGSKDAGIAATETVNTGVFFLQSGKIRKLCKPCIF